MSRNRILLLLSLVLALAAGGVAGVVRREEAGDPVLQNENCRIAAVFVDAGIPHLVD